MMNELNYGSGCTVPLGLDWMSQFSLFFSFKCQGSFWNSTDCCCVLLWLTAVVVHVNLHRLYQLQLPLANIDIHVNTHAIGTTWFRVTVPQSLSNVEWATWFLTIDLWTQNNVFWHWPEIKAKQFLMKVSVTLNKFLFECHPTHMSPVCSTCEVTVNSDCCRWLHGRNCSDLIFSATSIDILLLGKNRGLVSTN